MWVCILHGYLQYFCDFRVFDHIFHISVGENTEKKVTGKRFSVFLVSTGHNTPVNTTQLTFNAINQRFCHRDLSMEV